MASMRAWFRRLRERLTRDRPDPVELSLAATCVLLTQDHSIGYTTILLPVAALLYAPLRRAAALWFVISAALAWSIFESWWIVDNHKYLINYWTLCIGLALLATRPEEVIAWSARLLIGLVFLLSVVQKAITPDYLDGSFFHFLMLQGEPRFRLSASWLAGMDSNLLRENYLAVEELLHRYDTAPASIVLHGTSRAYWAGQLMTWWTQAIEALVAAAFLWPRNRGLSKWRDLILAGFLFTTYVVAQVPLFGWVLAAMGMAQCEARPSGTWLLYLGAFLAILTYSIALAPLPWASP